ncbi:MAG TPA: DUF4410 domain-containing protein [Verrucomicrobiae bacterium]
MNEKPPRPNRVLVHDFAVTPTDIPGDAPVGARLAPGATHSPEQIATDRQLGVNMGAQLVTALREMGLPAERALPEATPQADDIIIRGGFVSKHEGNAMRPFTVGLDFAASEWLTAVEGFQVTPQGSGRRPAINTTAVDGNPPGVFFTTGMKIQGEAAARAKMDDWARQTVKEIADRVRSRFQEQGWIN